MLPTAISACKQQAPLQKVTQLLLAIPSSWQPRCCRSSRRHGTTDKADSVEPRRRIAPRYHDTGIYKTDWMDRAGCCHKVTVYGGILLKISKRAPEVTSTHTVFGQGKENDDCSSCVRPASWTGSDLGVRTSSSKVLSKHAFWEPKVYSALYSLGTVLYRTPNAIKVLFIWSHRYMQ